MEKRDNTSKKAAFIVILGSLFYFYEFFIRVTPGAIANNLMADLGINAISLGFLSAAFFYAYAPMQIPAGLLCDRLGPSKVLTWASGICAIATLTFAFSPYAWLSTLARFFIGLSASFAFIGPLALAKRWIKPKYFAMATGFVQLLGCLGGMIGTRPIAEMTAHFGWRMAMVWAAICGVFLTLLYKKYLSDYPKNNAPKKPSMDEVMHPFCHLKAVLKIPQIAWIALIGFASWGPISIFAELWGANFLIAEYHATTSAATQAIIWVWLGIAVGSPIVGWWSCRIGSRKIPLILCFATGALASLLLVQHQAHTGTTLHLLLFLLGASASAQVLSFALIDDVTPAKISSTAVGFNNMAVIAGGVLLQPLVGWILQSHWDHTFSHNVPVYSLQAYHNAMLMLPALSVLGLLVTLFAIRETHSNKR